MADALFDTALVVTLWATGIELGITLGIRGMVEPIRRVGLFGRAAALDVVGIPLLVWSLVTVLSIPRGYAIGLLLVGAASAGPLGIKASQLARGDVGYAVSLVVVLEVVNAAAIPVWVALLMPPGVVIPFAEMLVTLAAVLLLPLALGAALGARSPARAQRLTRPLRSTASFGLTLVIALVVSRNVDAVIDAVGAGVAAVAVVTVGASLLAGWSIGGPALGTRISTALVTGIRANALALAIARASFPDVVSTTVAVVAFGVVSITLPVVVALAVGRNMRRDGARPAPQPGSDIQRRHL